VVNNNRKEKAESRNGKRMKDNVPKNARGIRKRRNAMAKWIPLDRMIDKGMIALGKYAFLMRDRSNTIEGVAFVSDREKKFHTRSPINRWK
jgi:hypothetical protein